MILAKGRRHVKLAQLGSRPNSAAGACCKDFFHLHPSLQLAFESRLKTQYGSDPWRRALVDEVRDRLGRQAGVGG